MEVMVMTLLGRMKDGVVVFENGAGASLADGIIVEVTPIETDVAEQKNGSAAKNDPFADAIPVSKERREALLSLIGICKSEHPPSDEEVKRIIDEERMRKYG